MKTFITDQDDPRLALYTSLTDLQLRNKLEPSKGVFIAEGKKVIDMALAWRYEPISLLLEEKWLTSMEPSITLAQQQNDAFDVLIASHELLQTITGYEVTRGALGAFRRQPLLPLETLAAQAKSLAVLVGITNAMNMGAILRNWAALGLDGFVVDSTSVDPLYRRALRSSMGCALTLPWTRLETTKNNAAWPYLFNLLKESGFTCLALALSPKAHPLQDYVFPEETALASISETRKIALFFGTEGTGLSQDIIDRCDDALVIPMARGIDSLNVASSSAIAFWSLLSR